MKPFHQMNDADLAFFETQLPGRVFSGAAVSEDYSHDEMPEYGHYPPEAVLQALSTEDVSAVLRYCNGRNIAVIPRGTGTGLCGGCVAKGGGVVLSTEKMKKALEVDTQNMTATLEPGVLLLELPKALEGTGLFYPPDPGEKTATIGGNAMTNAGGMRAVRYGVTRDYVLGMEVVLADGTVLTLGGKTVKTSSGYSLLNLMVGSEGTLGFLTKLTVKLIPEPKVNLSLLIPFDDLDKCIGAVPAVLACGCEPTAVEFMEREVIACAETYLGKQFPDTTADAYLLVRLDGASMDALKPSVGILTDLALSLGRAGRVACGYRRAQGEHLERTRCVSGGNQGKHPKHGRVRRGGSARQDRRVRKTEYRHRQAVWRADLFLRARGGRQSAHLCLPGRAVRGGLAGEGANGYERLIPGSPDAWRRGERRARRRPCQARVPGRKPRQPANRADAGHQSRL